MRNRFPVKEVLLLAGLMGLAWLVGTRGHNFAHRVGAGLKERGRDARAEASAVEVLLHSATPRLASYAADAVIGAGLMVLLLFLQSLITTPFALFKLHRRMRRIENQLRELREAMEREAEIFPPSAPLPSRAVPEGESWLGSSPAGSPLTNVWPDTPAD